MVTIDVEETPSMMGKIILTLLLPKILLNGWVWVSFSTQAILTIDYASTGEPLGRAQQSYRVLHLSGKAGFGYF
jgi:hypothetical protein